MRFQRILCSLLLKKALNGITMNFLDISLFTVGLEPFAIYKRKAKQQKDLKKIPEIRVSSMVVISKWDHLFTRRVGMDLHASQGSIPFSPVNNTGFPP